MSLPRPFRRRRATAFTLVELLVAATILVILLGIVAAITNQTTQIWRSSNARIEAFQGARQAFSSMTTLLSQATLNTYWDYDNPNAPTRYVRQSELHFIVDQASALLPGTASNYSGQAIFFQTPSSRSGPTFDGMSGLLNACGFWVEYGSNADWLPAHLDSSNATERFRLFQWVQPTEELETYTAAQSGWIAPDKTHDAYPVAENIIGLIIWARTEDLGTPVLNRYRYNSRREQPPSSQHSAEINQLPPIVEIALVAIDESTAARLGPDLKSAVDDCFEDLFSTSPSADFASDFAELERRLSDKGMNHRVFTSVIPLKEAKWSAD